MRTVVITGANRGLGLEFARQYVEAGALVFAGCREPAKMPPVPVDSVGGALRVRQLDINDPASRAAFVEGLNGQPVDLLINNAGIYGPTDGTQAFGALNEAAWAETLAVDIIAPVMMTEALMGNLKAADAAKVAFLSSRMGSIADNDSGGLYAYRSAKAGLNAAVKSLSIDLAEAGIPVVALHPGWVQTDMGGPNAWLDPESSISGMRRVIDWMGMAQTGHFINYDKSPLPW